MFLDVFWKFLDIFDRFGMFWWCLWGCFGTYRDVFGRFWMFGMFLYVLGRFVTYCDVFFYVLGHFGMFWDILRFF